LPPSQPPCFSLVTTVKSRLSGAVAYLSDQYFVSQSPVLTTPSVIDPSKAPLKFVHVKGTVQPELRWVKVGINRTAMKSVLPASVVYHAPRDTITRGALTFLAAVVLFDAIPTGWVSNHNSVGLIPLQRRYTDAVAAQRRSQ
jgi:hypothetical protein